jgi:hypothetical protein
MDWFVLSGLMNTSIVINIEVSKFPYQDVVFSLLNTKVEASIVVKTNKHRRQDF